MKEVEMGQVPTAFEPTVQEMHRMMDAAMARLTAHISGLSEQPASYDESLGPEIAAQLAEADAPEAGQALESLLDQLFDEALPPSYNAAGPGYLGYIPGGGLYSAALGEFVAAAINRFVGVWVAAPGLVQLEVNVLRWFCQMVGYPPQAMGTLTSGGSIANLSAVIAARRNQLGEDFLSGVMYLSDQAHYSLHKAGSMAGIRRANLRIIPTDDKQRVRIDLLSQAVADDRRRGLTPFLVVGNAGTTNTGAVDDLEALAELAAREGMWFHADAAYGGFFVLTERGRRSLVGLELADSITLDPHKGFFLPFGTGALLARDRRTLELAFDETGDYMPSYQSQDTHVDFCRLSPELSRSFRGLRIWLPLKLYGLTCFRECLEEKLELVEVVHAAVSQWPSVEVVAPPQLSVVAFRAVLDGYDEEALDGLNQRWLEATNARRRVFITGTRLEGHFVLRVCVLSFRTHLETIETALEDIAAGLEQVIP